MKLSTIIEEARKATTVYIVGHIHPDGDCVGTTLAMVQLLENAGVKAKVLLEEKPENFNHLPMEDYVLTQCPEDGDLLISMDASDVQRLGDFGVLVERMTTINIDHHISNTHFGAMNYVDAKASSTAEMLYYMVDDKSLLNKAVAEALYTGIIYDTGAFKHTNTTPATHRAAADLIGYGIDFNNMVSRMFFEKPIQTYKAQSVAYDRLALVIDEQIAVSWLTQEDYDRLGITTAHTSSIVQHLSDIKGVAGAAFFYPAAEGHYKASLRSSSDLDVCKVATTFGGGGHIKASGATLEGDVESCMKAVIDEMAKQL